MELLDILLIIVAVAAIIRGFCTGFITRIGALAAIFIAVIAARLSGPAVFARWGAHIGPDHETLALVLSYVIVFVACYLGVRLLARLIRFAIHALCLGLVDRAAGAVFSLFEWMLAASILINIYVGICPAETARFTGNGHALRHAVFDIAPAVIGYLQEMAYLK